MCPNDPKKRSEAPDLESSTENYARRFAGSVGHFFLEVQTRTVLDMLPSPAGCHVLDVGGGHGQLVKPLVEHGYKVTVVGSDDACRPRLDQIVGPANYDFLVGNLLDLPCEDDSYDVVLAFRLLPHLNGWQHFLGELCRVARVAVIIDYPDLRSVNFFSDFMFAIKRGIEKNTRTFKCFKREEIFSVLQRQRFEKQALRGQFLFPMALHRLLKLAPVSRRIERLAETIGLTRSFGSPVILKATPISHPQSHPC